MAPKDPIGPEDDGEVPEIGPEDDREVPEIDPEDDRERPEVNPEDEPIAIPITDELDLHTFNPRDILGVVDAYLEAARDAGFHEVRIVHGKGTGFQRERVHGLLATHPLVASYHDAPGHRGHWGATFVRLVDASR